MAFAHVVDRIRRDFTEAPAMELTLGQAARLWHLGADDCRFVLDSLVDAGFLRWTASRTIARVGEEAHAHAAVVAWTVSSRSQRASTGM